jgi:hypothetical protein
MTEVTEILQDVKAGRPGASDALIAALYQELRVLARRDLAEERVGHTLQPTALVHEVWMRLFGKDPAAQGAFENRAHFFSAASTAVRRVLVDHARRRQAEKRGGARDRVTLSEWMAWIRAEGTGRGRRCRRARRRSAALVRLRAGASAHRGAALLRRLTAPRPRARSGSRCRPSNATGALRAPGCAASSPNMMDPERCVGSRSCSTRPRSRARAARRADRFRVRQRRRLAHARGALARARRAAERARRALRERRVPSPADPLIGREIGPYRLTALIGVGGMGVVYRAQRIDGLFEREVAIKLIRIEFASPTLVRRFEAERRTLAALNHPNIAQLLDGGTTPDGRPYLVMELVLGTPIDRFCDEQRLSIEERLRLFVRVCGAVHYAHQNLVVHRDLKPGNILVDEQGNPSCSTSASRVCWPRARCAPTR